MFYVAMRNHSYECWRLTGSRPDWDDKERPFWIRRYDFDDVDLWPDEKLRESGACHCEQFVKKRSVS